MRLVIFVSFLPWGHGGSGSLAWEWSQVAEPQAFELSLPAVWPSPASPVTMQVLIQMGGRGLVWDSAFLTSLKAMPMVLVLGPHFEEKTHTCPASGELVTPSCLQISHCNVSSRTPRTPVAEIPQKTLKQPPLPFSPAKWGQSAVLGQFSPSQRSPMQTKDMSPIPTGIMEFFFSLEKTAERWAYLWPFEKIYHDQAFLQWNCAWILRA